jgi:pSer/pThr/pTyr-binding forkhead associated (FHA) protein
MARSLSQPEFRQRVGPFVLAEKPAVQPADDPALAEDEGPHGALATVQHNAQDIIAKAMLHMLEPGADRIAIWPPQRRGDVLIVGRLPDCHVVIEHPSVSKRHAVLRWDEASAQGSVEDVGSKNGTFVNGAKHETGQALLQDGDILSFGDVAFSYMLTETLWTKLDQVPASSDAGATGGARRKTLGAVPLQSRLKQMRMQTLPGKATQSTLPPERPASSPPFVPMEPSPDSEPTAPGRIPDRRR